MDDSQITTPKAGDRLGKYELLKELGRGMHGVVFEARAGKKADSVALKLFLPRDQRHLERLRHYSYLESSIDPLMLLKHENVAQVLDHGRAGDGLPFIVSQLAPGRPLSALLRHSGALSHDQVLWLTYEVLESLAKAHFLGIVHHNLSPANIFIDSAGGRDKICVTDFSNARLLAEMEGDERPIGSPWYMAPEQARGGKVYQQLDGRVDIYALGLIMAECLTARRVIYATEVPKVIAQQLSDDLLVFEDLVIASSLYPVIARAAEKQPHNRFSHAEAMKRGLEFLGADRADVEKLLAPGSADPTRSKDEALQRARMAADKRVDDARLKSERVERQRQRAAERPSAAPRPAAASGQRQHLINALIIGIVLAVAATLGLNFLTTQPGEGSGDGADAGSPHEETTFVGTETAEVGLVEEVDMSAAGAPDVAAETAEGTGTDGTGLGTGTGPGTGLGTGLGTGEGTGMGTGEGTGVAVIPEEIPAESSLVSCAEDSDCDDGYCSNEICTPDDYIYVAPGTFAMGSATDERGRFDNELQREVTLTRGFFVAISETTQGQWERVTDGNPSRYRRCGDDCPVERITWFDALAFANMVSEREQLDACYILDDCTGSIGDTLICASVDFVGLDCSGYRLPTEAEWEYAARGGSDEPTFVGPLRSRNMEELLAAINHNVSGHDRTVESELYPANDWGLYEVLGNVAEWTWDNYADAYNPEDTEDPMGPAFGDERTLRGGSFDSDLEECRTASRNSRMPSGKSTAVGFRLVRTAQ